MQSLTLVSEWPVEHVSAAVVSAGGEVLGTAGDQRRAYPLASVTKLLSAYATLMACREGAFELDDAAGPEGSTVRHLLSHASGLDMTERKVRAPAGTRRIYSNAGIEVLADFVADSTDIAFADYVAEGVLEPLGMTDTEFTGSPAAGAVSSARDLSLFAAELQAPTLLDPGIVASATRVAFEGLDGVLPGFGRQRPNDWGLGFELRDHKDPHWTGANSSPSTFGHFGQSGTFLWVDPDTGAAAVALTDRDFGPWAADVWPPFTDAVLADLRG
ncbi:serine hydrolase domain-containing protein [Spelaeicoccus albus]|uniref:CubicO group peptidase (Beta-lactamase class C family) n=1 Tax=Spelaeicoccus albus TaxID=1280376 RepID=A0A7Z0ACL6_9MICO|nr:serine hydrolase domain-containing protein [Spelaeicoccus albus]NYI67303.1 CubicO group peptidase (beta-lactamase class C family) [Spelaeicoccus albus]